MMKTQMTIFLLLLAGIIYGQKYFKSKNSSLSDYNIFTPSFEHQTFDTTGKKGAAYMFSEGAYVMTFFNKTVESVLPMDSINRLPIYYGYRIGTMISILIDPTGNIWDISFAIPLGDRKILTDEVLYRLYQKISEMRVDMSKVRISPTRAAKDEDTYGTHTLPLYTWPDNEKKKK